MWRRLPLSPRQITRSWGTFSRLVKKAFKVYVVGDLHGRGSWRVGYNHKQTPPFTGCWI